MPHSSSENIPGGQAGHGPRGAAPPLPLLLLAAGASSRMRGGDKLTERIEGLPLIRRQVIAALAAGLAPHVALPGPGHPRHDAIADLPHQPLFLPGSAEGMGGTLRDGVAALPPCPRFVVMAADLVGITADDLRHCLAADPKGKPIVIATSDTGNFGHPIIFDAGLRAAFATLQGDVGAKSVVRAHPVHAVRLPGDHATRDLDTPEDWAIWRRETGRE